MAYYNEVFFLLVYTLFFFAFLAMSLVLFGVHLFGSPVTIYKLRYRTFTLIILCRPPGTGEYDKFFADGIYSCAGCATALYKSTTKFNSGCGWPAFFEGFPGAINRSVCLASYTLFVSFWITLSYGVNNSHLYKMWM